MYEWVQIIKEMAETKVPICASGEKPQHRSGQTEVNLSFSGGIYCVFFNASNLSYYAISYFFLHSLTLTLSHSLSHTHSLSLSHSLIVFLPPLSISLSLSLSRTLLHSLTLLLSLSLFLSQGQGISV